MEWPKLVFLKNIKYKKIKSRKGINEIIRFLKCIVEISFMVVSENIIQNKPIKNVIVFNFE